MPVIEQSTPVDQHWFSRSVQLRRRFGSAVRAAGKGLRAGWEASVEHRALGRMSDLELETHGLSRSGLPRELYRRHFAGLGGWRDRVE